MFILMHSYVLMNPIKLHYQSLKPRDHHSGGFPVLVARYVVFLTTSGAADAVSLSMLTVLCFSLIAI